MDPSMNAPGQDLSINVANPGTVQMVVNEFETNLRSMNEQREAIEHRFEQDREGFEAVHRDLMLRIHMVEMALQAYYQEEQPPKTVAADPMPTSHISKPWGH